MAYIPVQGDIIYIESNPQTGHEQKGKRPALVVSNYTYNRFTKLAIVCPITNTNREFPLHLLLDGRTKTTGVIMCEQVKALDIYSRDVSYYEKAPIDIIEEALDIIFGFIEIEDRHDLRRVRKVD